MEHSLDLELLYHRLSVERAELSVKITKLRKFLKSDKYNDLNKEHQDLLEKQLTTMQDYLTILNDRGLLVFKDLD